jgi:predicted membrane-bound spermidine synthase
VGIGARVYDRRLVASRERAPSAAALEAASAPRDESPLSRTRQAPPTLDDRDTRQLTPFILAAAAAVGFAFLLMELTWYRVLSPLLGGSSYTFGLILAVALLGIGIGGLLYTLRDSSRPAMLSAFAFTCALEAAFIALPYVLGDRVALFALFMRPMGTVGLVGHTLAWSMVTMVVVLPAAIVAGYQFPLLIALLGRAKNDLGKDVGRAYAFNTLGAIFGSLAGGFVLFPQLGALGAWKLTVWLLVLLGAATLWLHVQVEGTRRVVYVPAIIVVVTLALLHTAVGPTA